MLIVEAPVVIDSQVIAEAALRQKLPKLQIFPELSSYFQRSPWMIEPVAELDVHSSMKSDHSWRMAAAAVGISQRLALAPALTIPFVEAAMCHDNGFVRIPNEITDKPGRLSDDEQRTVDRHTQDATQRFGPYSRVVAGLIETVHHFQPQVVPDTSTLAYYYSTMNYEDGLPLLYRKDVPRVLSALDKYDALRDPARRYRNPLSRDDAIQAILDLRDTGGNRIYDNFVDTMSLIADAWEGVAMREASQEILGK